jgi:hypothetical protein
MVLHDPVVASRGVASVEGRARRLLRRRGRPHRAAPSYRAAHLGYKTTARDTSLARRDRDRVVEYCLHQLRKHRRDNGGARSARLASSGPTPALTLDPVLLARHRLQQAR